MDGDVGSSPPELVKDGDLTLLIGRMLGLRGLDTVRVAKGKGHPYEALVRDGRVRDLDRVGNTAADDAADFGRRRVPFAVIDARRNFAWVCGRWYPVLQNLHLFYWAAANHDDGSGDAPDLLVWSAGALPKGRRVVHAVRDRAFLTGPVDLWECEWISLGASPITAGDVEVWPYSVGLLVKLSAFLGTLHWPAAAMNWGGGGVCFVEILFLFELWAGERLDLEKAVPRYRRPGREISVSAVPFGPGTDIWRSCMFLGALFRALLALPGGIGRFIPCDIGANHCRLRHIGWEKCGHGLTSWPRETAAGDFLNELLVLFRYPPRSAAALLDSTLPLRYCTEKFASKIPTWRLPVDGHVLGLVTGAVLAAPGAVGDACVNWVSGAGGGVKRVRLNRKTPAHLVRHGILGIQARPRVWKRLRVRERSGFGLHDAKVGRVHQSGGDYAPGVEPLEACTSPRLQVFACFCELGPSCVARVSVVEIHSLNVHSETTTTK